MSDLIITPSSGKIDFIYQSGPVGQEGQTSRLESIIIDPIDGLVFSGKISASSVNSPLNITATSSNINYPFIFASSGETGAKSLLMDSVGGTYNPSTNLATVNISGTSSWASNAVTSLVCTGNAATATTASYANALNAANSYTVAGITGALTGNVTGTATTASYANALNAANSYTVAGITGNLTGNVTGTATTASYANALNAANNYTVAGITGNLTGNVTGTATTASYANALNAANSYTVVGITGNLTGTATTASYANNLNAANSYTVAGITGNLTGTATTASYANALNTANSYTIAGLTVNGNFAVNGSLTVFSASNVYITSSNLVVTDNIITMNALSPYQRYAGIQMYDTGSGTLSNFLWDGDGDYFFLSGSSVNGKIITGPDSQANLSANFVPKATAGYKLGNSLIYDDGTNVGIGTTIPGRKLHLYAPQSVISLSNTGTGAWSGLQWSVGNGDYTAYSGLLDTDGRYFIDVGSNGEDFTILQNGNVGIGTTSPSFKLHTAGAGFIGRQNSYGSYDAADADLIISNYNYNNTSILLFNSAGAYHSSLINYYNNILSLGLNDSNSTNSILTSTAINITSTGVGIGTTSPAAKLQVNSTTAGATLLRTDGTNGTLFSVVDDLSDSLMSVNNSAGLPVLEIFADDRIVMGQYGQNDFVLVNNKVGIGTNNPANKLTVSGSVSIGSGTYNTSAPTNGLIVEGKVGVGTNSVDSWAQLKVIGTSALGGIVYVTDKIQALSAFPGSATNLQLNTDGGNVGIGTTLPFAKLHVQGNISGSSFTSSISNAVGFLGTSSWATNATTATTVTTNANLTGHITSTGNATLLGSFTSAQLLAALTDETGTGASVFANSPTLVTPALGTPSSGVLTNCTGTAAGLSIGGTAATASYANALNAANSYTVVDVNTTGNIRLRNGDPTITLSDTNHSSSFIQVDGNYFSILCGPPNASFGEWVVPANGRWPMEISLTNNTSTFGGSLDAISFTGSGSGLFGTAAGLSIGGTAATASYANALNAANSYTGVNFTATGFFQTNSGNIKSDTSFTLLTTTNGAQSVSVKGILLGTSYDTAPGANEIRTTNNTSLYLNARGTGDIQFQTADSLKMMLLNNGNVGIGESSPIQKLHVLGNTVFGNFGSDTYKYNLYLSFAAAADESWVRIYLPQDFQSNNNGGTVKLRVLFAASHASFGAHQEYQISYKTYYPSPFLTFSKIICTNKTTDFGGGTYYPASSTPDVVFYSNADAYLYIKIKGFSAYNTVRFVEAEVFGRTAATPTITTTTAPASPTELTKTIQFLPQEGNIYADGAIGIGTTSPVSPLSVQSNAKQLRLQTTSGPTSFFTDIGARYDSSHPFTIEVANGAATATEYFGIYADAGGANNRIALLNGNVGIGTTNPVAKLHVQGNISGSSFTSSISNAVGFLGTSSWATNATNALQLGGTAAASYVTLADTQSLTNKTLTSPILVTPALGTPSSGNLTSCTFPTLNQNTTGTAATASYANALNPANSYTVTGITGNLTGTSSWATNAVTALNVGNGTITIAGGTGVGVGSSNTFTTNQSGATTVTITNTGVTSNVAGTGISVSGATGAVTITNSGVTSAVAGTGVGVSAATGPITFSIGQAVGTAATPTFASVIATTFTGALTGTATTASYANALNAANSYTVTNLTASNIYATDGALFNFKAQRIPLEGAPQQGTHKGYLILAKAYTSGNVDASYVIGKVILRRGNSGTGHDLDIYEVNSSRGYNTEIFQVSRLGTTSTRFLRLVKVTYGGVVYHAIETSDSGGQPSTEMYFEGSIIDSPLILTDASFVSSVSAFGNAVIFVDGSSNVGIGTTNPVTKLETYRLESTNRTTTTDILTINADANNSPYSGHGGTILFRGCTYSGTSNNAQGNRKWGQIGMYLTDAFNNFSGENMFFAVAGDDRSDTLTTAMTIQYNGNVGIGVTTPTQKLEVAGYVMAGESSYRTSIYGSSGGAWIGFGDTSNTISLGRIGAYGSLFNINSINGDTSFQYNGSEKMRITTGGLVGIGTTVPSTLLHAYGADGRYFTFSGTSGLFTIQRNVITTGGSNPVLSLINTQGMDASGVVGRGTAIQLDLGYGGSSSVVGTAARGARIAALGETLYDATAANQNAVLAFFTSTAGTLTEKLRIRSDGSLSPITVSSTTAGATLLRTDGTSGTLFSVVDDLSDSLMSVNNSAGLPVLEVFADDRIVAGQYGQNDFVVVNNKVGIGTNNPLAKLHVTSSTSIPSAIFMGGNVGIGTTSPVNKLEVVGSIAYVPSVGNPISISDDATYGTSGTGRYVAVGFGGLSNGANKIFAHNTGQDGLYICSATSRNISFRAGGGATDHVVIKSDGNLGVGTSVPTTPLHVVGVISGSSFTGAGTGLTGTATSLTAGTATNATQFGSEANTNFMRGLAGGTEANIDTYTDNGFRTVAYTGHGKGLLSFNVGSSIGTVQHEYFYNTPANGWRIRNKTDSTAWSAWGNVVMTDTNQGALTGTIITTNSNATVSGLTAGAVTNGVYTTGAQSVGGVKSFTSTMNVTGVRETMTTVAAATNVAINLNLGTIFKLTFSSTVSTFTITNTENTNVAAGNSFTLISAPDNSNAKTIAFSFSTNGAAATAVKWATFAGGTTPTATITSGKFDVFSFVYDGVNWYGFTGGLTY